MSENAINKVITTITFLLLILSIVLVFQDSLGLELECPIVANIKLCDVIFVYFLILFFVQLLRKFEIIFILIGGFALTLSLIATLKYFFGKLDCKLFIFEVPFCLIIFMVISVLIILKFIQVNKRSKS